VAAIVPLVRDAAERDRIRSANESYLATYEDHSRNRPAILQMFADVIRDYT
jgi:hypothetical protein